MAQAKWIRATGKSEWSTSTIDRMLSNEKYIGVVLMQKTYTADFLTGRRERNEGQLDTYLVEDAHEPIIDKRTFELAQRMKGKMKSKKPDCLAIMNARAQCKMRESPEKIV